MTWLEVNLSEVADVQWGNTSITKASYVDKGFPAFSATGNDGYVEHAEHNVDGIVLSAIGARCGKCFLASGKWTAIKNTITIVPNPSKIHLKYLYVILNDEKSWLTKGAAQPFITLGIARNRKIPLPPLAEQKRIAALLDTADNIMRLREQAIAKLDALAQSVFVKKINEIDCKEIELCDIAEMYQPKTISTSELIERGQYLVYGANGVIGRYDKFNHEEDEVLVTCRGATCGTINRSQPFSWITGNAMVVKPIKDKVTKDFLQYYFKYCADFSSVITGAAQPQITRQTLSRLRISLPNLKKQNEISDVVNEILLKHEQMNITKIKSEALISSLQHQSFAVN